MQWQLSKVPPHWDPLVTKTPLLSLQNVILKHWLDKFKFIPQPHLYQDKGKHLGGSRGLTWKPPFSLSIITQRCALRKIYGSPVLWTCEIQCTQHMICMNIVRFSSSPRVKVRRHRPPGSARVQACGNNDISQLSDARFSLNFCWQIERWELHQEPAVTKMFSYIWWVHMPSEIAVKLNFLEWLISVKLVAPPHLW